MHTHVYIYIYIYIYTYIYIYIYLHTTHYISHNTYHTSHIIHKLLHVTEAMIVSGWQANPLGDAIQASGEREGRGGVSGERGGGGQIKPLGRGN